MNICSDSASSNRCNWALAVIIPSNFQWARAYPQSRLGHTINVMEMSVVPLPRPSYSMALSQLSSGEATGPQTDTGFS